jgi:predicted MFS family arabinose efflux permease
MITHRRTLTSFSFTAMFFLGVGTAIIGAASKNIGLDPSQVGLLITAQNIGFIGSVVVSGALADSLKKPVMLAIASFILAVSLFFYYMGSSFWLNFFIMLFIGVGIGGYEGVADAMLLDIHTRRESLFITVNHFFVTFGELMITVYLIFLQMQWRRSMIQSAGLVLVLGVLFLLSRSPDKKQHIETLTGRLTFMSRQPGLYLMLLMAVFAVGTELGLIGILTSFLMDLRGFTQVTSKIGLIVHLGGIATGRLFLGFTARRERLWMLITLLFGLSAAVNAVLLYVPVGTILTYFLLYIGGVVMSVIFPLIISLSGIKYQEAAGTVMGIVKLGVPLGGIILPFIMASISRGGSFPLSLIVFPAAGVLGFVIALFGKPLLEIRGEKKVP